MPTHFSTAQRRLFQEVIENDPLAIGSLPTPKPANDTELVDVRNPPAAPQPPSRWSWWQWLLSLLTVLLVCMPPLSATTASVQAITRTVKPRQPPERGLVASVNSNQQHSKSVSAPELAELEAAVARLRTEMFLAWSVFALAAGASLIAGRKSALQRGRKCLSVIGSLFHWNVLSRIRFSTRSRNNVLPAIDQRPDAHDEPNSTVKLRIPEPEEQVERLVSAFNDLDPRQPLHSAETQKWRAGWARNMGPVRTRQEDYVLVVQVGDVTVGLLADGAGGHPDGDIASHRAVVGAAQSICQALAFQESVEDCDLEAIAREAISEACRSIAVQAAVEGAPMGSSMRSTLIVVLATSQRFSFAHCGDGGAWAIQVNPCRVKALITPAKGAAPHVLLASLGPQIDGEIESGTREWNGTRFLAIASDGVADEIEPEAFFEMCMASCCENRGHFTRAATSALDLLAQAPNINDNLSLAFIARPPLADSPTSVPALTGVTA